MIVDGALAVMQDTGSPGRPNCGWWSGARPAYTKTFRLNLRESVDVESAADATSPIC